MMGIKYGNKRFSASYFTKVKGSNMRYALQRASNKGIEAISYAVIALQKAINNLRRLREQPVIIEDGIWGPQTTKAFNALNVRTRISLRKRFEHNTNHIPTSKDDLEVQTSTDQIQEKGKKTGKVSTNHELKNEVVIKNESEPADVNKKLMKLAEYIAEGEGTRGELGYEVMYGGTPNNPQRFLQADKPITEMTISELLLYQKKYSDAVRRYNKTHKKKVIVN